MGRFKIGYRNQQFTADPTASPQRLRISFASCDVIPTGYRLHLQIIVFRRTLSHAWRWTRKIKAKTVTVALSEPQADQFKFAIANHRRLELIITQMRELSQKILLQSVPGPRRRATQKSS